MNELLPGAFGALGMGPSRRDFVLVADALVEAGAVDELERAAHDLEAFRALVEVAEEAGSNGFVALDLVTRVHDGEIVPSKPSPRSGAKR